MISPILMVWLMVKVQKKDQRHQATSISQVYPHFQWFFLDGYTPHHQSKGWSNNPQYTC
jgi:hypothetical protein